MLVINSLLSILSIGLPGARKHGKITVHVTLSYNMGVGHQLSIIYFVLVFQWQEDMVRLQYM
jgi:hypothetical protein